MSSTSSARARDLEAAISLLDRAAKKMIDGSSGAEAMNKLMEARRLLKQKVQGLQLQRRR